MSTLQPLRADDDVLLRVRGTVQGVGFRPFVYRLATALGLRGWVRNDAQGVLIRACGPGDAVAALERRLADQAPPAARVREIERARPDPAAPAATGAFRVIASAVREAAAEPAAPPDLALCEDCRRELSDPRDRRYRYPFINCTQCGPRYSILEGLPYDRPRTTMRRFAMCRRCRQEYEDPANRRYHAEPNACPRCGPRLAYSEAARSALTGEAALDAASAAIAAGKIVAVKGIGGYHLMVDATSRAAVEELRRRKRRGPKPFAVLFADLSSVAAAAEVSPEAARLLGSREAPIVLLPAKTGSVVTPAVAPGNPWVGALLAYSPLHVLLAGACARPLVATSANLSEEPLCHDDAEARRRLAGIADAFLSHDRPIAHPVDDSVVRLGGPAPIVLRRARGYAPTPLRLPAAIAGSWLCTGAQQKNTVAVARGRDLVVSPHIGDLEGSATLEAFHRAAEILGELHGGGFTAVACDPHPRYASTRFARASGLPCFPVQHHLAHVLSCLLENEVGPEGVLGVAWDGTGYGEDGTVWGGEFLLLERGEAVRFARFRPFRLPGGDAAIRDGRRVALALARSACDQSWERLAARLDLSAAVPTLARMIDEGINSPWSTSAGRLFDAVGAVLGLGGPNRFEGETALAVEAAATASAPAAGLVPLEVGPAPAGAGALLEIDWMSTWKHLAARPSSPGPLAAAFHRALAQAIVEVARQAGARTVALSGGCFQNALLLGLAVEALQADGRRVLIHRRLPPNDGGISAGQAAGALWRLGTVRLP